MSNKYLYRFFLLSCCFFVAGCSLGVGDDENSISQQDIDAVAQIIGESLSDENSGIVGSISDALGNVSANGFVSTAGTEIQSEAHDENTGRGNESNISYQYTPGTGIHRFSFQRTVNTTGFQKEVFDTTRYIYTDNTGSFIEFPAQQRSSIESVFFTGVRQGTIITPERNSFFLRRDTLEIAGVSQINGLAFVEGIHRSEGSFEGTSESGQTFERDYKLEINFLNIKLNTSFIDQSRSIEQGIQGAFTYVLTITDAVNTSNSRTIRGSIDMLGDGTATLRLNQQQKFFQVNLDNGQVRDADEEFEGQIISADPEKNTFTLVNGVTVEINPETNIEADGDFFSLEAVRNALQSESEDFVRAEGEGFVQGGIFKASNVEFELDDDVDDENNDIDFVSVVQNIDLQNQRFTLSDGRVIQVNEQTVIEDDGDFLSLQEVSDALQQGIPVVADGDARYVEGEEVNYIAEEVEFEIQDSEDDDSNGGEESDFINFDDLIESVNVNESTFTLQNGAAIKVTSETEITGDFANLQAVSQALNAGQEVKADGRGIEPNDDSTSENITLIATRVEFETEEEDDDDD